MADGPGQEPRQASRTHTAAALLAAGGCAAFAGQDTTVKWLTSTYPLFQIISSVTFFALLTILAVAMTMGRPALLRPVRWRLHLARGVIYLISMSCGFFAYRRMPIADAYAIVFTAPLIMTALSAPVLGEAVGWRRWSAVGVGFAGLLVMVRPGFAELDIGLVAAMVTAVMIALSAIIVRLGRATEHGITFAFTSCLFIWSASTLSLPFGFVTPSWPDLGLFAMAGILGGMAMSSTIVAYTMAPIAVVAPFPYTQILWGAILGYIVFGDLPAATTYAGAALVAGSGLYIVWREARLGRGSAGLVGRGRA